MKKAFPSLLTFFKLTLIGISAGVILIIPLKILYILTGNTAYILLFNFDYVPVLNQLRPVWLFGYIFHFVTCICSVIGLYYILKYLNKQLSLVYYIAVYTVGGGALFFLTCLSNQPPAGNDFSAWFYWTIAHAVFGFSVGLLVKKFIKERKLNIVDSRNTFLK